MRRLCRGILPMGLLEYLGMWCLSQLTLRGAVGVEMLTWLGA